MSQDRLDQFVDAISTRDDRTRHAWNTKTRTNVPLDQLLLRVATLFQSKGGERERESVCVFLLVG